MSHKSVADSTLIRFWITIAAMTMIVAGCSKPGPVSVDPPLQEPRVGKRILYSVIYPEGTVGIDWSEYDGSRRQTLLKPGWILESQPRGGRFVAMKYDATDSLKEGDSLFVVNIADRKRTLIGVFGSPAMDYAILSPDGLKVLHISGTYTATLTIMNIDGTGSQVLTTDAYGIVEPSFSPDGSKVAYAREEWSNASVRVVGIDGSNDREIVDTLNNTQEGRISWSPDGSRIAYTGFDQRHSTVAVVNIDGSGWRNLTDGKQNDFNPAWSPDGSRIAFTTLTPFSSNRDIAVMNADGSERRIVTVTAEEREGSAQWSPDGGQLLFTSSNGTNLPTSLRVLDLSSSTITTIVSTVVGQGYWDYSDK
jgi:Tol biopolymer transport system component